MSSCVTSSDAERHVALVLRDVALEDVGAGSQNTLEALSVEFDALERTSRDDRRSARSVEDERDLT